MDTEPSQAHQPLLSTSTPSLPDQLHTVGPRLLSKAWTGAQTPSPCTLSPAGSTCAPPLGLGFQGPGPLRSQVVPDVSALPFPLCSSVTREDSMFLSALGPQLLPLL